MEEVQRVMELVSSFGVVGVLLMWLTETRRQLIEERAAHNETRKNWMSDIRDIAGMNTKLSGGRWNPQDPEVKP